MPRVLAGVIYAPVGQIDYFVIGYFHGSSAVGYYRVAFLLASNLLIVLTAVTPVFKPMVAESRHETALLQDRYRLGVRWMTMLTIPMAVTLLLAPAVSLTIRFTGEYAVAGSAVVILTIGSLLNASFGPEGMMLEGLGHNPGDNPRPDRRWRRVPSPGIEYLRDWRFPPGSHRQSLSSR